MPIPASPVDVKSPVVVPQHHARPVHVWAAGIKTPLRYQDPDGRLKEGERHADQTYGQNNWHVSLEYKDFTHLADLLAGQQLDLPSFVCGNAFSSCGPIEDGQIARLAILAHGAPGALDVDGRAGTDLMAGATDPTLMNVMTLPRYAADFTRIERVLQPRAKVLFVCCLTGAGSVGEEFVKAVSLLWAAREVMVYAFSTVLYQDSKQRIQGSSSYYPGARESDYDTLKATPGARYYETTAAWNDLARVPWASENSSHAVMAYKGVILKQAIPGNFAGLPGSSP